MFFLSRFFDDPVTTERHINIKNWPDREDFAQSAAAYRPPELERSQLEKLLILNRFIELFTASGIKETAITSFLAKPENQFILEIAFTAKKVFAQVKLEWLNEPSREPIKPDFFVTQPNGFSDIVDFKLPVLKRSLIVGRENREAFNSELNSYVAQIRTYVNYFEESIHRTGAEKIYGIKVRYPQAWIVIGRRSMFADEVWKEIENDYRNFRIKTYDDLVDLVTGVVYAISPSLKEID